MINNKHQGSTTLHTANLCSVIGRIGNGRYFAVGAYYNAYAETSGKLQLGVNDTPPTHCELFPPEECYSDNTGQFNLLIQVTKR